MDGGPLCGEALLEWVAGRPPPKSAGRFSEVAPGLFVGNAKACKECHTELQGLVSGIVCLAGKGQGGGFEYLWYHFPDQAEGARFVEQSEDCVAFMARHAAKKGVLVHCSGGINRSPAVAAVFLIRERGLTAAEAARVVTHGRPSANLSRFRGALEAVEAERDRAPSE
eukprot:Hpha_TRINITY_DN33071_c0_g1::TRINITY_DN33071_c0_g1_i1::g.158652::m.158652